MKPNEIIRAWELEEISTGDALMFLTEVEVNILVGIKAIREFAKLVQRREAATKC